LRLARICCCNVRICCRNVKKSERISSGYAAWLLKGHQYCARTPSAGFSIGSRKPRTRRTGLPSRGNLAQSLPMWDAHTELTSLSPPRTNSRSGKSGLFPARGQRCHRQRKARSSLSHVDGIEQKIAETRSVSGWPLREGDPIIAPPPFPLVLCIHLCAFARACFC
jgi:hypothetical protein